jgi:hypothetical protein
VRKEPAATHGLLALVPLFVLGTLVAGLFFVLSRVLPPLVAEIKIGDNLPRVTRILPFLLSQPFLTAFVCLCAGGLTYILGPRTRPLKLTAWYLGGAFVLALWVTLLLLLPQTCSYIDGPRP